VREGRPIESSCSWMLHRNPSLFLSSIEKGSFFFSLGNAMQEVGNQVVSDDEKSYYAMHKT